MTLIAVFSTLRLRTLCTFSHEPPHLKQANQAVANKKKVSDTTATCVNFFSRSELSFFLKEKEGSKTNKRTKEEEIEKEGRRSG